MTKMSICMIRVRCKYTKTSRLSKKTEFIIRIIKLPVSGDALNVLTDF